MLLEFRTENYKSFKNELVFSMRPRLKHKDLDSTILVETEGEKTIEALSAQVIYGANAAGKTNIIGAIQTFKCIVLRGNINNKEEPSFNLADSNLEFIPNTSLERKKNVSFSIEFFHKGLLVKYAIELDLGSFLEKNYKRSIVKEILDINEKNVFERNKKSVKLNYRSDLSEYMTQTANESEESLEKLSHIANDSMDEKELFLVNGFKNIVSSKLAFFVTDYFSSSLVTCYRSDRLYIYPSFNGKTKEDDIINTAASEFSDGETNLSYVKIKDNPSPYSFFNNKGEGYPIRSF